MYNTFIANNNCRHVHKRGLLRPGNIYLGFCTSSLQFYKITTATTRKKTLKFHRCIVVTDFTTGALLLVLKPVLWSRGGGVLPEKFGRGVRPASRNPYPIYEQNLRFSLPY